MFLFTSAGKHDDLLIIFVFEGMAFVCLSHMYQAPSQYLNQFITIETLRNK